MAANGMPHGHSHNTSPHTSPHGHSHPPPPHTTFHGVPPAPAPITTPRIAENYIENGREYHGYRKGKYLFPCDELEMDRMDIYHKFFSVARGGALHSAPVNQPEPRILDVGTGTGIWAIDMCDKYRTAEVHGIDLTMIQPQFIPEALTFTKRDFESPWNGLGLDSWDLIHMRMLNGSVSNWPDLYAKVFRHLKPVTGWLEHVEIDLVPRCDDGTLAPTSQLVNWARYVLDATLIQNMPLAYNTETRSMLEKVGFVNIQEQVIKVPFSPWPTDPHLKDIGRWYNLGLTQGLEALTLAPMTRNRNWTKADVDRLVVDTKKEICSKKIHAYCEITTLPANPKAPEAPARHQRRSESEASRADMGIFSDGLIRLCHFTRGRLETHDKMAGRQADFTPLFLTQAANSCGARAYLDSAYAALSACSKRKFAPLAAGPDDLPQSPEGSFP
ncbi:hypothetical protein G7Y89_g15635 [Cudoniella acicularis]|uniref:Methyltransferase n=1 Tax=Cudoniella acicularis TaxID=354080 RepID=A0A8H4QI63_9HELO|nr:hypothetical protein G7Y89_g15635 [Cudoniella acicularis]